MTQCNPGVIEGFFGNPWNWELRRNYAAFLKRIGYSFYIYAPKADQSLRKNWRQPWSETDFRELVTLSDCYHQAGLQWGIGLSPFEIYLNYDRQAIDDLSRKIQYLNQLNPDILAILFDDMRGDADDLSQLQLEIVHRIAEWSSATTLIMCPTYYSDDPILEKLFGKKPDQYLQRLGKNLDPAIHVFWTGPQVCSTAYPEEHLKAIAAQLGRPPFLWDNYPVNDGAKLSPYLHLRAFENRPYQISQWISGHAVNPMNQGYLSQIPLMTLALSYQQQDQYSPAAAFVAAVECLCMGELSQALIEDLPLLQDQGLDQLSAQSKQALMAKYAAFDSPYGEEIVQWLGGAYLFSPDCLT